jgi:hypothetical protein
LSWHISVDPAGGWDLIVSFNHAAKPPTFVGLFMGGDNQVGDIYGAVDFLRFDWTPDWR